MSSCFLQLHSYSPSGGKACYANLGNTQAQLGLQRGQVPLAHSCPVLSQQVLSYVQEALAGQAGCAPQQHLPLEALQHLHANETQSKGPVQGPRPEDLQGSNQRAMLGPIMGTAQGNAKGPTQLNPVQSKGKASANQGQSKDKLTANQGQSTLPNSGWCKEKGN